MDTNINCLLSFLCYMRQKKKTKSKTSRSRNRKQYSSSESDATDDDKGRTVRCKGCSKQI
jgi:hypothetical protein